MDIQIRALGNFMHGYYRGRLDAVAGATYEMPQIEANALVKAGLVEIRPEATPEATPETAPEAGPDYLLGGEKMEEEPQNKMAAAPANKKAR